MIKSGPGFDIVNIQFALHYFFESTSKLEGFLQNVSENLKNGGYFIGTCFDWQK
jgi:mRNA (guanine-N7-)-methyltransferase